MKNFTKSILILTLIAVVFSCADEALDPLQFKEVKKGTLLALRGPQLDAIYFDGADYAAVFYPNSILGNEKFDYDAEFLSEDPNSLESVDIFVYKQTSKSAKTRVALTSIPGSAFQVGDYRGPSASISLNLSDILAALGETLDTQAKIDTFFSWYGGGVKMESDLNLKDGSKVLAASLVSGGLFESDQFYPAQILTYGVEDIDDARPVATLSQRGQYSVKDGKPVYTIIPLKSGARDTLIIKYDQQIASPPAVAVVPASAGTLGTLVKLLKKNGKDSLFYIPFVAGGTYTGNAAFVVSGATSAESGALSGLGQSTTTKGISGMAVDNLAPQNTSFTTGTRVGKDQSATITLKFNEAMGTAPTITVAPGTTGIDGVTDVKTTLSADGLTATYVYEYKDLDNNATHGNATVSVAGGKDKAGNDLQPVASKPLTIDIGAALAPVITVDPVQYDWGTQIKWTMDYFIGPSNIGGSTSGTVYYLAQENGKPAPVGFVGGDVPAFTMAEDPASTTTPKAKVAVKQFGTVAVTTGTSGTVYSAFTPNGTLDVYVVIVTSSGVISAISTPTTVTML